MTKETIPLVSIGLPTYNGEQFIRQSLDSLLAQDYEHYELIISDNASTDKTHEICLEYKEKDPRIQYYRNNKNEGPAYNFSRVLNRSSGTYFMWASDHDLWDKSYIRRCVEILEKDLSLILCSSFSSIIDLEDNQIKIVNTISDTRSILDSAQRYYETLWSSNSRSIYGLIRLKILNKIDFTRKVYGIDFLILNQLSFEGGFAQIPETLFYSRTNRPEETFSEAKLRYIQTMFCNPIFPYTERMFYEIKIIMKTKIKFIRKIKLIFSMMEYFRVQYKVHLEILHGLFPPCLYKGIKFFFRKSS